MSDQRDKRFVQASIDSAFSTIQGDPRLAQRIMNQERTEKPIVKKKVSFGLVLAIVLMLITVTALAVALLSPKEIVEKMAVPTAQNNQRENFTYEELAELLRALNENGITLDEGSTLMQAFQSGHGYWEREVIEEICYAAFGRDQTPWTLEQWHWYGEMLEAIGALVPNVFLLPEEGDLTQEEACELAARMLMDKYGVAMPLSSDENWQVSVSFALAWDPTTDSFPPEKAEWDVNYVNRKGGSVDYSVTLDRDGRVLDTYQASYYRKINTQSIDTVLDDLENRDGTLSEWNMETWAEFGELIRDLTPTGRNGWLYRNAGYRLPPENAVPPEKALETALGEAAGTSGSVRESLICCTDKGRQIYKVCLRVFHDGAEKAGRYDAVWCVEMDCITGDILDKREYAYGPDSDPMMMYVPFSLLAEVPAFENDQAIAARERAALEWSGEIAKAEAEYGVAYMYFLPLERQAELFGGFHTVPAQEELEKALAIAKKAVAEQYGADALDQLGDYKTGVMHQVNGAVEDGEAQHMWDFMFTTDPTYLSDGYRVQFRQLVYSDPEAEAIRDLMVEHANLGNG